VADLRHDFVRAVNRPLEMLDAGLVRTIFTEQIAEGNALISRERGEECEIAVLHSVDMQFLGQSHLLAVNVPHMEVTADDLRGLFAKAYWQRFQVELDELRPVLVNLHTAVIGKRKTLPIEIMAPKASAVASPAAHRQVWFDGRWLETPVYQREQLPPGTRFAGPAIVEQLDATIVVEPPDSAHVDRCGNIVIEIGDANR
jgi:N-methylhydantoinase A